MTADCRCYRTEKIKIISDNQYSDITRKKSGHISDKTFFLKYHWNATTSMQPFFLIDIFQFVFN